MPTFSLHRLVSGLLISWLVCGIVVSVAGFFGWIYPWLSMMLAGPLFFLIGIGQALFLHFRQLKHLEKILILFLIGVWMVHFTGVLVPETGFDAVWYHLPVVKQFAQAHSFVFIPDFYQSVNPLFSDAIFLLGFQIFGQVGTKLVAFGFGLTLVLVSYQLARLCLNRTWSLTTALLVSSIQVVTWQASSFYIDVTKAVWELTALWFLLKSPNKLYLSGLFLGASLASKFFSILLIPVYVLIVFMRTKKTRFTAITTLMMGALTISLPFYVRTYYYTGWSLVSGQFFLTTIPDVGGSTQIVTYIFQRLLTLPLALTTLTFGVRDYVSILFLICLPLVIINLKNILANSLARTLLLFSIAQLLIWWFIPPLSTRYTLSGFIVSIIVYLIAIERWIRNHPNFALPLALTIVIAICFNLAPRAFVLKRNMEYILIQPPLTEYIPQFYDGWIDVHLQKWYQLP